MDFNAVKHLTTLFYRRIMVVVESVVSGHQFNTFRDRLAEKIEVVRFDPYSKFVVYVCMIKIS